MFFPFVLQHIVLLLFCEGSMFQGLFIFASISVIFVTHNRLSISSKIRFTMKMTPRHVVSQLATGRSNCHPWWQWLWVFWCVCVVPSRIPINMWSVLHFSHKMCLLCTNVSEFEYKVAISRSCKPKRKRMKVLLFVCRFLADTTAVRVGSQDCF